MQTTTTNSFSSKSLNSTSTSTTTTPQKEKKRPCCVCKDTRKNRDLCVSEHGQDFNECIKLIKLHNQCLRNEGFNVRDP